MLELRPQTEPDKTKAKLILHAIETPQEKKQGFMARKVFVKPSYLKHSEQFEVQKDTEDAFFVKNLSAYLQQSDGELLDEAD